MLRALAVMPDAALAAQLEDGLKQVPDLHLSGRGMAYPSLDALLTAVRVERPDFLFVSCLDSAQLSTFVQALENSGQSLPLVGLGRDAGAEVLLRLMHLGIREYLTFPLDQERLNAAVRGVADQLARHPAPQRTSVVHTFLPAKPGVGCSTIALAIASTLAENPEMRTLLLDADLYAGPVKFLLKLGATASFADALTHADALDEDMWRQMVAKDGELQVLHAGDLRPTQLPSEEAVSRVLKMARALYDVICVDLAGTKDPLSQYLLTESQHILLVTTPELVPMHFAREQASYLRDIGVLERVSLVVNRHKRRDLARLTDEQVAEAVGVPVTFTFPNVYHSIQSAVLEGEPVPQEGEMVEAVQRLAQALLPHSAAARPGKPGRKFLEFFRIPGHAPQDAGDTRWRG